MDHSQQLPDGALKPCVIDFVRAAAAEHDVELVVLYGSRARGDFKHLSDIDLAYRGGHGARFFAELEENLPTLLRFDLVDLDEVSDSAFRENILREGAVLYERGQLANYRRTLANLETIRNYDPPYSPVVMTGIAGLFELAFESSWKLMKEVLENAGYEEAKAGSPKGILRVAYEARMITDEDGWLGALRDRNTLIHTYDEKTVLAVVGRVSNRYLPLFRALSAIVEREWATELER